jgi:hypothetical protein
VGKAIYAIDAQLWRIDWLGGVAYNAWRFIDPSGCGLQRRMGLARPIESESEAESTVIDVKGNRIFLSNLLSTPLLDKRSVA